MDRKEKDQHRYDDIINLPHHVSTVHPSMSDSNRAAQFAPFAALTGYEDAISETGRLTDQRIELDEDRRMLLDERLQMIMQKEDGQEVKVTYFVEDERKEGGEYVTVTGSVKRIDMVNRAMILTDGKVIPVDDVIEIEAGAPSIGRDL